MRQPLPERRPAETITTEWEGHAITATVGFYLDGRPGEIFADVAKGALRATLSDACTIVSVALQHGITPDELAKSLGHVPVMEWNHATQAMEEVERPASPIGAVLEALREAKL